ncbi:Double-strand break repair protein mre11a [Thoreauomyces humboldtii]|nr:Double-strand break repair protein mre11a [Thoreauomyces humboldtii]
MPGRRARPTLDSDAGEVAGSDSHDVEAETETDADTFKILIATDNHIGYMEKDPIRGNDSFDSFEEILQLAQTHGVDFILLGGDLFHDNKPSRKCMHNTMTLLRQYCMGDRPCPVEILSDQKENFSDKFGIVNYEDPNYNVGMPVFSIHGNHDDPSGDGSLCALDLLSAAGLVNYFGKQTEVDDISIKPILLRKGSSKVALYGLGNVRDERLNRTFQKKKVKMFRPEESMDEWFNMLVIHQNRYIVRFTDLAHGPTNYIPESFLDDFLQLILWGHEHECLVDPVHNSVQDFHITQPGSSVATSLCEGEAVPKHVAILKITGQSFRVEPIRLRSVRPFIMDEVSLKDINGLRPTDQKAVNEFLQERVEDLIERAMAEWEELHPGVDEAQWPKPLIRLRVEYSGGFTTFNPQRFGQAFVQRVANPKDILQFHRKRAGGAGAGSKKKGDLANIDAFIPEKLEDFRVEDLVTEYLNAQNLDILPENELGEAVRLFVEKEDREAIKDFLADSLDRTRTYLTTQSTTEDSDKMKEEIDREKKSRVDVFQAEVDVKRKAEQNKTELLSAGRRASGTGSGDEGEASDEDLDEPAARARKPKPSTRGQGAAATRARGRGRGAAAAAAPRKSRAKPKVIESDEDEVMLIDQDNDEEEESAPPPARASASAASSTGTARKRKLPASLAAAAATPAAKRKAATGAAAASKPRQSKLAFGASQSQRAVNLEDDDDGMTFSNFNHSTTPAGGGRTGTRSRR